MGDVDNVLTLLLAVFVIVMNGLWIWRHPGHAFRYLRITAMVVAGYVGGVEAIFLIYRNVSMAFFGVCLLLVMALLAIQVVVREIIGDDQ